MGKFQHIKRLAGVALLLGGVALLAAQLPADTWSLIGQKTALAAVSLQQADEAAARLSEKLTRLPVNAGSGESAGQPIYHENKPAGADQQPMTEPTAAQAATAVSPPAENGTGGKVVEQVVKGGDTVAGIQIKNKSGVKADVAAALAAALPFQVEVGSPDPQVLLYHTHTTEGYMPYDAGYYNSGDIRREPSYPYNVTVVGDALEAELTAAGIAVLHVTDIYDHPQYRGAYERSVEMMQAMLKQYPSIKVTIDLHRDGLMANSTDKLKPTVTVNEKKAAQMMVVCGVLSTEALPHPNWQKNLSFATKLQQALAADYGNLMRPLSLVGARYNQYVTTGSLLIEVGSEGNTLDEAVYSAHLLGQSLAELLI